jgi:preprotein translocase subunit Sec63
MIFRIFLFSLLLLLALQVSAENFYESLGVAPDADDKAIKKAYRNLSLKYHPGKSLHF